MPETDFEIVCQKLCSNVKAHGDVSDILSWKKVYPDLEFEEVDSVFTGDKINWDEKTLYERAFYVVYMRNPQDVRIYYCLDVEPDGFDQRIVSALIKDSEIIWYMWMAGCFKAFSGNFTEISPEAKNAYLYYAIKDTCFEDVIRESVGNNRIALKDIMFFF